MGRVVAKADSEDVDRAVAAATRALNGSWGGLTPADRARMLWRFADLIEEHADDLATLESLDNGKPFAVGRHGDIPFCRGHPLLSIWPASLGAFTARQYRSPPLSSRPSGC